MNETETMHENYTWLPFNEAEIVCAMGHADSIAIRDQTRQALEYWRHAEIKLPDGSVLRNIVKVQCDASGAVVMIGISKEWLEVSGDIEDPDSLISGLMALASARSPVPPSPDKDDSEVHQVADPEYLEGGYVWIPYPDEAHALEQMGYGDTTDERQRFQRALTELPNMQAEFSDGSAMNGLIKLAFDEDGDIELIGISIEWLEQFGGHLLLNVLKEILPHTPTGAKL